MKKKIPLYKLPRPSGTPSKFEGDVFNLATLLIIMH